MTAHAGDPTEVGTRFVPADGTARLGVVVVTQDDERHLDRLLQALREQAADVPTRVVVVDNGSSDATVDRAESHDDVLTVPLADDVGHAAGVNVALDQVGDIDAVLVLAGHLVPEPRAVPALLRRLLRSEAGIVLPLVLDEHGGVLHSLRREPCLARALGDAVLGDRWGDRPGWLSETVRDPTCYAWPHPVDWGAGGAMLIRAEVARRLGPWDERFLLPAAHADYCRRARQSGWEVWFEPTARVRRQGRRAPEPPRLTALSQVNRVTYARKHGSVRGAAVTSAVLAAGSLARVLDAGHRSTVAALLLPGRRRALAGAPPRSAPAPAPAVTVASVPEARTDVRGAVVIPAHDEVAVIGRMLAHIAPWARAAGVEVLVVCNGCTDRTADVARAFAGVRVLEIPQRSKVAALNAGDEAASAFPRLYVDADIRIEPAAIEATLRALADGPWLAARPPATMRLECASRPVRAFYRARQTLPSTHTALWGAGVYGLSEVGHARLGTFPPVLADDLWVDELFRSHEKAVVDAPPVQVSAPRTARSLLRVLRRTYRGNAGVQALVGPHSAESTRRTLAALARGIRGPRPAADAAVYAALVTLARVQSRDRAGARWERDESSRQ